MEKTASVERETLGKTTDTATSNTSAVNTADQNSRWKIVLRRLTRTEFTVHANIAAEHWPVF